MMDLGKRRKMRGQRAALWCVKARAECLIRAGLLFAVRAPLTAVVNTGNPRHGKEQGVNQRQVRRVLQQACDTGDIMIIHKAQKMLAAVQRPRFRPELPQQRMCDLKKVHGVKAGVKPLIALIVGAAV